MQNLLVVSAINLFQYSLLFATCIIPILYFLTAVINFRLKVPYVPTGQHVIKYIAELAQLKPGEKVYDLGCGDGRFLIEAQKYTKTTAIGFENSPFPYLLSKIKKFLSKANIKVYMENFFPQHFKNADVIFCYLGPETMQELGKKLQRECRKGTRIYSNSFAIKYMTPIRVWPSNKEKKLPTIYFYQIS